MDNKQYYRSKAKDSFKTKFNLYLFNKVINQKMDQISSEDFQAFIITDEIVNIYTTEYWQENVSYKIKEIKIDKIYNTIENWTKKNKDLIEGFRRNYVNSFTKIFPGDNFNILINHEKCDYCGITKDMIEKLGVKHRLRKKNLRGWSLEIDRKNPNYEYTKNNCVMSCYWCNNAKTDEFLYDEFKEIGKAIRQVWEKRLNK